MARCCFAGWYWFFWWCTLGSSERNSLLNESTLKQAIFTTSRCVKPFLSQRANALLPLLVTLLVSCGHGVTQHETKYLPPPKPRGGVVATVDITPPVGSAGRKIFAGLKREGRIVARGEAVVPGSGKVQVIIQAMDASRTPPEGEYELWLTVNSDPLESCYPSYGDLFVHEKWNLQRMSRTKTLDDPSVWKERKLSKRDNLITVHYHRYDEDYDNVGIWTWDFYFKRSPEQNEIFEVGRDDYGPILQLDRGDYGVQGDSDKIGLVPRLAGDWNHKDGEDKFWRPNMRNEIYLIGGKDNIWTQRPDTSPQVVEAYLDEPNRVVIQMSRAVNREEAAADRIMITDGQKTKQTPVSARILFNEGKLTSNEIELKLGAPLDIASRVYEVSVQGFAGSARILPRAVLDDTNLFYDANAVLGATYTHEATTFRVFAPTARAVQVVFYDQATGDKGRMTHDLRAGGKGIWEATEDGDLEGKFYMYKLDGENLPSDREVLDIYCVNAVNGSQRARITDLSK